MIVVLLVMLLFIGLGFVFINGKGSCLISGFNTMSLEEKEQYDVIALCKFWENKQNKLNLEKLIVDLDFSELDS